MEPPDIQFLGICHGHTQKITCMVLDPASGQARQVSSSTNLSSFPSDPSGSCFWQYG